ncbi:TPA: hypothetical protein DEP21_02140 [Patescibacteria group bacterium]|nr:hypothetical protein [Candidatus Gracilibacteria bacterium]
MEKRYLVFIGNNIDILKEINLNIGDDIMNEMCQVSNVVKGTTVSICFPMVFSLYEEVEHFFSHMIKPENKKDIVMFVIIDLEKNYASVYRGESPKEIQDIYLPYIRRMNQLSGNQDFFLEEIHDRRKETYFVG